MMIMTIKTIYNDEEPSLTVAGYINGIDVEIDRVVVEIGLRQVDLVDKSVRTTKRIKIILINYKKLPLSNRNDIN